MMLVIGDTGQAGVEGHHDEGELRQGAQQTGSVPTEARLQVELHKKTERSVDVMFDRSRTYVCC